MRLAICWAGVLVFFAFAVTACSDTHSIEPDRAHCQQLRDHLVDLRLAAVAEGVDVKAHRAAMKQALGEQFIDNCEAQLSGPELECSLRARDLASASACSKSK